MANLPETIWYGQPWSVTLRFMVDGVVYSLLTAGAFAGFWPGGRPSRKAKGRQRWLKRSPDSAGWREPSLR